MEQSVLLNLCLEKAILIRSIYLSLLFTTHIIWRQIRRRSKQGTVTNLHLEEIQDLLIPLPNNNEQENITLFLESNCKLIPQENCYLNKLRNLKSALMQDLLTGKVRVPQTMLKELNTESEKIKTIPIKSKGHNWEFNEAVVISVLTHKFGSEQYPLGRKRCTKISYLLHRYKEKQVSGYLKKAAGPYNPRARYGGPEKIALLKGYVQEHTSGNYKGFIKSDNIQEAISYFNRWYGSDTSTWLEQFQYEKNDTLELWTTVDMAIEELQTQSLPISPATVKKVIHDSDEWRPKLKRAIFSDDNIQKAIRQIVQLSQNTSTMEEINLPCQ